MEDNPGMLLTTMTGANAARLRAVAATGERHWWTGPIVASRN
jgi:hypothetical protein